MKHFANPLGLPKADPATINVPMLVLLVAIQMVYVCMVYGAIAAFLVELFPIRIRYSSMSLAIAEERTLEPATCARISPRLLLVSRSNSRWTDGWVREMPL